MDAGIFHADLAMTSGLTSAPVTAFGFLTSNPGSITVEPPADPFVNALEVGVAFDPGSGASIPQTLALIGGDISVNGGILRARGGTVQLASRASPGEVLLPADGGPVEIVGSGARGTITLSGGATVDATDIFFEREGRGGTVYIRGGQFFVDNSFVTAHTIGEVDGAATAIDVDVVSMFLTGGANFEAGAFGGLGKAGKLVFRASDTISVGDTSSIVSSSAGSGALGGLEMTAHMIELNGGTVATRNFGDAPAQPLVMNADILRVVNGGTVITETTSGVAAAGPLVVTVKDSLLLSGENASGRSAIRSLNTAGEGATGDTTVTVTEGSARIENGARVGGDLLGGVQSGSILVDVAGDLTITGRDAAGFPSAILNVSGTDGQSGPVDVRAGGMLNLVDGQIRSVSGATGSVGNATVTAGSLSSVNGRIEVGTIGPGDGGILSITTTGNTISLTNGSSISSSTTSSGNAGAVTITTPTLNMNNSTITTSTSGTGSAGSVTITTTGNTLSLSNGSRISSASTGTMANAGDAGSVTIMDSGSFTSNASTVATSAENAKGGDISITAQSVQLLNGTSISASSNAPLLPNGEGDAGNIRIDSASTFVMKNSSITTEASQASGGQITINAPARVQLTNSTVSTSVAGIEGDTTGGDITIDPNFVILQNSQIIAQAFAGTGGNITITAGVFLADPNSLVDASSQLGISGTIDIQAPVQNLSGALVPLSQGYLAATSLLAQRCAARHADGQFSTFVVAGRDGLPLEPGGLLPISTYVRAPGAGTKASATDTALFSQLASASLDVPKLSDECIR
jgi:large exoprotein involved in heme utilization and adhesion